MKRKLFRTALWALVLTLLLPALAHADTGPKPSVRIRFTGLGDRLCYGTLLSETKSTGPASVWNGDPADAYHKGNEAWADLDEATWWAFVDYQDSDGYHFLQWGWPVSDTDELAWTYYPPDRFKVLLYFPDDGTFVSGDVLERYAFHSYFDAAVTSADMTLSEDHASAEAAQEELDVAQRQQHLTELLCLAGRILLTLAAELLLALVFGFRQKRQLAAIAAVNVATQLALNAALFVLYLLPHRYVGFIFFYVLLELAVFAVEALLYCRLLRPGTDKPILFIVIYALCANVLSFVGGLILSFTLLPWMF